VIINFSHPSDDWPLQKLLSFRDRTSSAVTAGPSSSSIGPFQANRLAWYGQDMLKNNNITIRVMSMNADGHPSRCHPKKIWMCEGMT
jgi:hypothetical protein